MKTQTKEQLGIEDIAPYLPYGLKGVIKLPFDRETIVTVDRANAEMIELNGIPNRLFH